MKFNLNVFYLLQYSVTLHHRINVGYVWGCKVGFVSSPGFLLMLLPCSASFWGKILVFWFLYILKFYVRYIFYGSGFVSPLRDHGPDKILNRECCCRNMETQIWLDFNSCYSIHCRSTLNNGKREAHCFCFFEMHRWWDEGF